MRRNSASVVSLDDTPRTLGRVRSFLRRGSPKPHGSQTTLVNYGSRRMSHDMDVVEQTKSFYPSDAFINREIPDVHLNPVAHRLRQEKTMTRMRLMRKNRDSTDPQAAAFDDEIDDQNLRYLFMIPVTLKPKDMSLYGLCDPSIFPTLILSNTTYVPRMYAVCQRTYREYVKMSEHVLWYVKRRLNILGKLPRIKRLVSEEDRKIKNIQDYLSFMLKQEWVFQIVGFVLFLYTDLPVVKCFGSARDTKRLMKTVAKVPSEAEKAFFHHHLTYEELYQYSALVCDEEGELGIDLVKCPDVIQEYIAENPDLEQHPYDNCLIINPNDSAMNISRNVPYDSEESDDDQDDQDSHDISPPVFICGSYQMLPHPEKAGDGHENNPDEIDRATTPTRTPSSPISPSYDTGSSNSLSGRCQCGSPAHQSYQSMEDLSKSLANQHFLQIGSEERVVNTDEGPKVYIPKPTIPGSCPALDRCLAAHRSRSSTSRLVTLSSQRGKTPHMPISGSYSNDDLIRLASSLPANMGYPGEPIPGPSGLQQRVRQDSPCLRYNSRQRHLSAIDEEEKSPKKKRPLEPESQSLRPPIDVHNEDEDLEEEHDHDEMFGIDDD
eukprot:maker-scaffold334_size202906-snap-gene-0.17 protein:Tk08962 transcript:maker-scaffold334_size202906-snap-gene-0.17-mRNA-1 annotation:"haloacid dehalogenase"